MIIVTSPRKYKIGEKFTINFDAGRGIKINPPQPSIIVRVATRDEYRNKYLNSEYASDFLSAEEIHGPVPKDNNFYEVSTD